MSGASLFERYVTGTERVTVPDVLAAELRAELRRLGFTVFDPDAVDAATGGRAAGSDSAAVEIARAAHVDGAALWTAIERWEPDGGAHPAFVIVAVHAALVDPTSGTVVWRMHRSARPVATPGTVTVGSAYGIAARKIAEELLGSWRPSHAEAPPPGTPKTPR